MPKKTHNEEIGSAFGCKSHLDALRWAPEISDRTRTVRHCPRLSPQRLLFPRIIVATMKQDAITWCARTLCCTPVPQYVAHPSGLRVIPCRRPRSHPPSRALEGTQCPNPLTYTLALHDKRCARRERHRLVGQRRNQAISLV